MTRIRRPVREVLSTWQFWTSIAYFGIAATIVALFVLFNRTAREDAIRVAAARSAAQSQVTQCMTSVKDAPVITGFIDSHEAIIDNGLLSNRAALKVTPSNSPLYKIRAQSIARLEKAKENANDLRQLIDKTTHTKSSCLRLARKLGVAVTSPVKTSH